jgi:hypothetical protein
VTVKVILLTSQATANDGCSSGYNEKGDTGLSGMKMTTFRASSDYNPPQNGQMPVSPHDYYATFSAPLFEEMAAEPKYRYPCL